MSDKIFSFYFSVFLLMRCYSCDTEMQRMSYVSKSLGDQWKMFFKCFQKLHSWNVKMEGGEKGQLY